MILVVEDDPDFRELLVEHLLGSGYRVRTARDGAEALETMAREDGAIGLVLVDLRMPVMDGFELCRRIEASKRLPRIPIIVMTAEHETHDVGTSRRVIAVLQKPLELERLDALVEANLAG